jgi:hypothetical protein
MNLRIDRVVVRAPGLHAPAAHALGREIARSLPDKLVAAVHHAPRSVSRIEVPALQVRSSSSMIVDAVARSLARRLDTERGGA